MDNLELLTDDELRIRLLQYGFPNLPITQTTRKTLIKKLRNHKAAASSNLRKTTSLATRYSSGEESDSVEKKSEGVKTRKSRMTVSGSPGGRSLVDQNMPPPSFTQPSLAIGRTSVSTSLPPPSSAYSRSSIYPIGGKKNSVYVSPVIINDSEDDDIDWSAKKARPLSNNSRNVSGNNRSADLYTTLDSSQRNLNGSNGYDQDDSDDHNSTSDYTKRLLQFREGNLQKNQNNARKRTTYTSQRLVSENDIVYHAEPSLEPAHIPLNTAIKNFINRLDAAYGFKQTFVPMVLVTFLIIFFLLIIFVYITISPDIENMLNPSTASYVACKDHLDLDASYACIDEQSLQPALDLLKVLATELQSRAVAHRCGDKTKSISNVICVKDFINDLNDNQIQSRNAIQHHGLDLIKDIHNIEYLIEKNKNWGIQNVNLNGEPMDLNDVVALRAHQAECFSLLKPKLPIICTIYNKIQTFFFIIGSLAIVSLGVFVARKTYQVVVQIKQKRRAQIDMVIREICSTLMEKSMIDKDNPSVVVNHLRDKIIEATRRTELSWAWQEAIRHLEQNDSRVHFGVETINGEDFKVMRWIEDVKNTSMSSSLQNSQIQQQQQMHQQQKISTARYQPPGDTRQYVTLKKWMGSAFDKSNKIKDPPTNCLKIRQMFDKYEANNPNLQTIIQDTILHKLREKNCKIYDIQLDAKTCCAYVKCASCADAGIVHEEINGWWLDTGLVVVKFLKQDKYHQRFPSAINACTVLHPSANVYITQNDPPSNGHEDYFDDDMDDDDFE